MADGVEVGRAHVAVTADGKAAARKVESDFSGLGSRLSKGFAATFTGGLKAAGIATGVTAIGAGIVKGFGAAVTSAGNFEKSMRLVGVTTKVGEAGLNDLTQTAIEMGAKTSFSAQGASDAMVSLAKGGLTAAQIQGGALEQTLTLATAGGLELGKAADYMVSGLKGFGLQAGDSARVAAALAGGANASTASVESMGLALSQVAAQAATAGLSIEDTTAGIAALANNGIQGSDAGTSLKVMLQRLVPQTEKAAGTMKKLGLITKDGTNQFFDAQGNMKSLTEVSGLLQNALKDQTKEQKINTLYRLFGSDATRAASILAKEGAAGLAEYTKATSDQTAAQSLAQNATKGFSGAMERFKGSIETVGIQIGTKLLPSLTKLLNFMSNTISGLQDFFATFRSGMTKNDIATPFERAAFTARSFAKAISDNRDTIGFLASVIAGAITPILLLKGAIQTIAIVTKVWAAAQALLNIVLTANPIGIVVVALAGLVAGLIYAWKHSETFRNVVLAVWGAVKGAVLAVVNWLVVNVPRAWETVKNAVVTAVTAVAGFLKKAFMLWTLPMRLIMTAILTIMVLGWMAVRKPVMAAFTFIRDRIIVPVWNFIINRFRTAMATIQRAWSFWWGVIRSIASAIWNFVFRNIISPVWNRIRSAWTTAQTAVRNTWSTFWGTIKRVGGDAIDAVRTKIKTVLDKIKDAFSSTKTRIKEIWDGLKKIVSSPINWIKDNVYNKPLVPVWNRVADLVKGPRLETYARGGVEGVRPGYTPGRDTHLIGVGGGEAIMRPEFTRMVGEGWVNAANRAARHGRMRKFIQEGGLPSFAGGGVAWLKNIVRSAAGITNLPEKIKDFYLGNLAKAAGLILNPTKSLIDKAMPNSGVGRTIGGVGKKSIDLVLAKIKAADDIASAAGQTAYTGPPGTGGRNIVRWHGGRFTQRFANTLQQAQQLARRFIPVIQGGFRPATSYSGTSHRGDAIDTIWNSAILGGLRRAGVAAWHRTPADGFAHHIHGVPLPGRGYPGGSGIWQAQDYLRGGNGLANGGIAPPGWSMVGERGPEWVNFRGGERVLRNGRTPATTGGINIFGGQFGYSPREIAVEIIREQRHQQALNPVFG